MVHFYSENKTKPNNPKGNKLKVEKNATTPSLPNKGCYMPTQPRINKLKLLFFSFGKERKFDLPW